MLPVSKHNNRQSKKRMSFPMDVPSGLFTVKIYKVCNKAYHRKSKRGRDVESNASAISPSHERSEAGRAAEFRMEIRVDAGIANQWHVHLLFGKLA